MVVLVLFSVVLILRVFSLLLVSISCTVLVNFLLFGPVLFLYHVHYPVLPATSTAHRHSMYLLLQTRSSRIQ